MVKTVTLGLICLYESPNFQRLLQQLEAKEACFKAVYIYSLVDIEAAVRVCCSNLSRRAVFQVGGPWIEWLNQCWKSDPAADIMFVHSCVWMDQQSGFEHLLSAHHEASVIGPKVIRHHSRQLVSAGRRLLTPQGMRSDYANRGCGWRDRGQHASGEVESLHPALILFRGGVLERCGGFDPQLNTERIPLEQRPVGFEFDDICLKVSTLSGQVWFESEVAVYWDCPVASDLKHPLVEKLFRAWERKWGWHPLNPDLHVVRQRWGGTALCSMVDPRIRQDITEEFPPVDVLMVTCNAFSKLRMTLDSLIKTEYPHVRLFICDNSSQDATRGYLEQFAKDRHGFSDVTVVTAPTNMGFVPAFNWLLKLSDAPLVAKLDDDIELPKEWLSRLVDDLRRHPFAGAVAPKIVFFDSPSTIQFADFRMHPPWKLHMFERDMGQFDYLAYTSCLAGTCVLHRRRVFEIVGPYDLRYSPSQTDDFDHAIAMRMEGFDLLFDGRVAVKHMMSSGIDWHLSEKDGSNAKANVQKLFGKWGNSIFEGLEMSLGKDSHRRIEPSVAVLPVPDFASMTGG
jgi:GT2 family glycosyltransferase